MVGDVRPFNFPSNTIYATVWNRDALTEIASQTRDPKEILRRLRERGVTHVWIHWGEIARLRETQRMYAFVVGADGRFQGAVSIDSMHRALEVQPIQLSAAFLAHIAPVPGTLVLRELVGRIVKNPVPLPVIDTDHRYLGAVTQTILLKKMVQDEESSHE